jgi:hypothetical protein
MAKTLRSLRNVEDQLTKDLEGTTITFRMLANKYGVSKQAISYFCQRKGVKRPKREHKENCSICQGLLRIARQEHSDFISSPTITKRLKVKSSTFRYHINILRRRGLISKRFGKLRSTKLERAYQIYFKKRLPVRIIGWKVGIKNFGSILQQHKALGWDVPDPLFIYDRNERWTRLKMIKMKKKEQESIKRVR